MRGAGLPATPAHRQVLPALFWASSGVFAVIADAFQNEPAQSAVVRNCQQTLQN